MIHTFEIKGIEQALARTGGFSETVAYVAANAINTTLVEAQKFTIESLLPQKFTLRSKGAPWYKPGGKYGFNVRFATKETLMGTLGSQADWLQLQEFGGSKKGSGHRLAIPGSALKDKKELVQKILKPSALLKAASGATKARLGAHHRKLEERAKLQRELNTTRSREAMARGSSRKSVRALAPQARQRRKALEAQLRHHDRGIRASATQVSAASRIADAVRINRPFLYQGGKMPAGIYVRAGAGRNPILRAWLFEQSADIQAILGFEPTTGQRVEQNFNGNFNAAFARAMKR